MKKISENCALTIEYLKKTFGDAVFFVQIDLKAGLETIFNLNETHQDHAVVEAKIENDKLYVKLFDTYYGLWKFSHLEQIDVGKHIKVIKTIKFNKIIY